MNKTALRKALGGQEALERAIERFAPAVLDQASRGAEAVLSGMALTMRRHGFQLTCLKKVTDYIQSVNGVTDEERNSVVSERNSSLATCKVS